MSRYMLSKNYLAAKVNWQPSALSPSSTSTCTHTPIPRTCCCGWSAASSGWLPHPSAAPSAGDLPVPSVGAQAFLPPPGNQGEVDSWGSTRRSPAQPSPIPTSSPFVPSHFLPLPLALLLSLAPQWLAVQSPAHLGTGGTTFPLPETNTQEWSPGTEFRIRGLSPRVEEGQPQRLLWGQCWVQFLTLSLTNCMTLGRSRNLPEPQFPQL